MRDIHFIFKKIYIFYPQNMMLMYINKFYLKKVVPLIKPSPNNHHKIHDR